MLIAIFPLLALIVGLLMWRPTLKEAGKAITVCALLVTLYVLATYTVRIG